MLIEITYNTKTGEITMKKFIVVLATSLLLSVGLIYFEKDSYLKIIGLIAFFLGLAMSGTLVSGDRMRANTARQSEITTNNTSNLFLYFILFSLPLLIMAYVSGVF